MSKAVVILGAGASADFGIPTLAGVFKDVHARRYVTHERPELLQMLRDTFWRPRGHDLETSDQSLTVEEMLTALRDWEREPNMPAAKRIAQAELFRRRLYVLIYRAVFSGKSSKSRHLNPLIELFRRYFERVSWVSFNWDCMFESSFYYSSGGPGPYQRTNPYLHVDIANWHQGSNQQELLKLHGSISWWLLGGRLTYLQWGAGGQLEQKWTEFDAREDLPDTPVILEPSYYKYADERYRLLEGQWNIFFQRLLEADCVLIVGYSLPEADQLARSKILSAFHANDHARWLVIDPSPAACGRYRRLLGQQVLTVANMTLAGFNNDIVANLQAAFPGNNFNVGPAAAQIVRPN